MAGQRHNPGTDAKVKRRELLKLAALSGGGLVLGHGFRVRAEEARSGSRTREDALFASGLTQSLREERRYEAKVCGRLPAELRGALYKNGPGLFERAGRRKRTLLDGDGMISAYRFADGKVEFQNRFVRTPKFEAEEAAGHYLIDSWTTPVNDPPQPGGDQAGVTIWSWGDRLYAFDEGNAGWELAPQDLGTIQLATFGLERKQAVVFAHGKQLADSGQFSLFGVDYANLEYNHLVLDETQRVVARHSWDVTAFGPPAYMHDWFVTPHYFVLHAMPALIDGEAIARGSVLRDALRWQPQMPSRLLVFRREDPETPLRIFEMQAAWMWHTANAFERGSELVLDWIGYDDPFHFVGAGAEWETIMLGELRPRGAPGALRRSVLDLQSGAISTERFGDLDDQEFPCVAPSRAGQAHRYTYLVHEPGAGVLYQSVAKVDLESGRSQVFDFGSDCIPLEPVFAARPSGHEEDDGWLLVEVADAKRGVAVLHILDARCLEHGAIATVELNHPIPMRFHGHWAPGAH